ncbi:MAG: TonB-dependent receptor [Hyphomonadaceae bacterium]|nr:TonB-dependent receptor [Hyphomonadaceae bacterium]MBC6411986.1 TonB-dependent receptor [Hyphomonadaceae bacterium]
MKIHYTTKSALLLSISVFGLNSPGHAQQDEIIVTATKRAESIQDVPVSVAAIDANTIRENAIIDIADASLYIPNFEFSDASILPNLYIRGIGSGTTHSIEQSVGRFIDEVYIGRAAINLHSLMDIGSIEVLRGPQGTLFGKNTLAGAVIINTADPTPTFDAGVNAFISDYSTVGGQIGVDGFISGPLSDGLSARLSLQYKDRDGYIENFNPGPDGGTRMDYGARLKLLWEGSENTTVGLKLEYLNYEEEGQTPAEATASVFPGGPMAGRPIPVSIWQRPGFAPGFSYERNWQSHINCEFVHRVEGRTLPRPTFCPGRDQETYNVTLDIERRIDGKGVLKFITGYQSYNYLHQFVAVDMGVAGGAARFTRDEEYSGFTQEVRFTSDEFDKYDFIVGGYFETSSLERLQPSDFNVRAFLNFFPPQAPLPFDSDREDWTQDTETWAAFGQLRYHFNDQITAILGGRYSYETKDYAFEHRTVELQGDIFNGPFTDEWDFSDDRSEGRFTPSFTLQYEPSDDLLVFGSISQGHKTGGYGDRLPLDERRAEADLEFDPEINTAYEVGFKGSFLDGALTANLAAFYMDIQDLQVATGVPTAGDLAFEVKNAAEATSQGIEFDARWRLTDNVTIGGDMAITDAAYDDFPGASRTCPTAGGTIADVEGALCNFAGLPLIFAPDFKASGFIQFQQPDIIGGWDFRVRGNVNHSSQYYTELEYREALDQDAYTLFGANAQFISPDDTFTIGLVGRNLTEEHVVAWGFHAGFTSFVTPNTPRELMVQLGYRY